MVVVVVVTSVVVVTVVVPPVVVAKKFCQEHTIRIRIRRNSNQYSTNSRRH